MKTYFAIIMSLLFYSAIEAQNLLSEKESVNRILENNFDIKVARNNAEIDSINNTKGNAGMLPSVSINGGGNYSFNNIYQKNNTGTISKYPYQSSLSLSANTELAWTLYDGGKMFVTKNKLNEIQALGELQFRQTVLETIYNVVVAYYNIVMQEQELKSIEEAINYDEQRLKIAQTGFNSGSLAKTDFLQAAIDLNVDKENAVGQEYAVSEAKKNLNNILGRDPSTEFEVQDSITFPGLPDRNRMLEKLNGDNMDLKSFEKQIEIARLALKETQKTYSPTVNLSGGYYLGHTRNSEGSILKNYSFGPGIGLNLSIPLYTGGESKRKIALAKKELESSRYGLEKERLQINTDFQNTYDELDNQKKLLKIEEENNKLSKENLEISLQRLKLGQTTSLEVHQAQESYVQSSTRIINFKYNLKIAETKLKQLANSL